MSTVTFHAPTVNDGPDVLYRVQDRRVLIKCLDRLPFPFEVYLTGYGHFGAAFKGATTTLKQALRLGARHDYCRQFEGEGSHA